MHSHQFVNFWGPSKSDAIFIFCRNTSSVSSGQDLLSNRGSHRHEEWNTDLLGCCSEPSLCKFFLSFSLEGVQLIIVVI